MIEENLQRSYELQKRLNLITKMLRFFQLTMIATVDDPSFRIDNDLVIYSLKKQGDVIADELGVLIDGLERYLNGFIDQ